MRSSARREILAILDAKVKQIEALTWDELDDSSSSEDVTTPSGRRF